MTESRREARLRLADELEAQRLALFDGAESPLLRAIRREVGTLTRSVYILSSTPEQAEDVYDVLLDGTRVVRLEVPRMPGSSVRIESWPVSQYASLPLGRVVRRKLVAARQLADGSMSVTSRPE